MERMTRGLSSKLKVHGRPQHRAKGVTVGLEQIGVTKHMLRRNMMARKLNDHAVEIQDRQSAYVAKSIYL